MVHSESEPGTDRRLVAACRGERAKRRDARFVDTGVRVIDDAIIYSLPAQ